MKRHEFKNPVAVRERMAEKWKKRLMFEKGYSEECAEYMAQRLIDLIDHMQYGYALIAFHKQGTIFKMVKATLMPYESFFHRFYEMERIESTIVYWDVESQAWRSFQLENLLDWSPVC